MQRHFAILILLLGLSLAQVSQLQYQVGDEFQFDLHSSLDTRGQKANQRTPGAWGTMDSTVVVQCTDEDDSSYLFVMNMWDTSVDVHQDSDSSNSKAKNVGDWLGEDMYFQQAKTGEITKVWYQDDDSPYFVEVKVGAINAFQTHVVPLHQTQDYLEIDPVGKHESSFLGTSGPSSSLLIHKTFTQHDIDSFPDSDLSPSNVNLTAYTSTLIHSDGHIAASSVTQLVNLIDIKSTQSGRYQKYQNNDDQDTTAVDVVFSSFGNLSISELSSPRAPSSDLGLLKFSQLQSLQSGNLFEISAKIINFKKNITLNLQETLHSYFTSPQFRPNMLRKITRYLKFHPHDIELVLRFSSVKNRPRYATLISQLSSDHELALNWILNELKSSNEEAKLVAIFSTHSIEKPHVEIALQLKHLAFHKGSKSIARAALYALGATLGKIDNENIRKEIDDEILRHLQIHMKNRNVAEIKAILHAIQNAGPKGFPMDLVPSFNLKNLEASNFPFNKSYSADVKLGGTEINADFSVLLFAGTNFDCKQNYFNYEVLGQVSATLNMWQLSKEAFYAEAIYGKANGQLVGNEVLVRVFGDVIYDHTLPTVDCNWHEYEIGHVAPGYSISYTVWIAVIPVTFTATAGLDLNLQWGWEICDSNLAAEVELIPTAVLDLDGDAELDLLIIKAGIELTGSFNTALIPQGYIHGSLCEVGFDVVRQSQPMDISLTSYYAWDECEYWIFDCHWGQHHQHTWFQYQYPAVNEVIYQQNWNIN